jgi:arylsulfatase A-like enzyme
VATSSDAAGLIWNRTRPCSVFDLNVQVRRPEIETIRRKLGPVPDESMPNRIPHVEYTARAVSEHYLDDPELDFIVVWLSEPDHSLHHAGVGSPEVRLALAAVDRAVGEILDGLERRGIRDQFDILLISDHGHSSVSSRRSLGEHLDRVVREQFPDIPQLLTASDFVYPSPEHAAPSRVELEMLVEWLLGQPWCGAVFGGRPETRSLPGVLPLEEIWGGYRGDRSPLFAVNPAWSHAPNGYGMPGIIACLTEHAALRATHGSASPHELHAFAVTSGPSFDAGETSCVPAGAQDLAPTVLSLLGVETGHRFDGRLLSEVFKGNGATTTASSAKVVTPENPGDPEFRPALVIQHAGSSSYLHSAVNGRSSVRIRDRQSTATRVSRGGVTT